MALTPERLEEIEIEIGLQPLTPEHSIYVEHPDSRIVWGYLERRQSVLLVGPRRAGKTTIVTDQIRRVEKQGGRAIRAEVPVSVSKARSLVEARALIARPILEELPGGVEPDVLASIAARPLDDGLRDECWKRGRLDLLAVDEIQRLRPFAEPAVILAEVVRFLEDTSVCGRSILCGSLDPPAALDIAPSGWQVLSIGRVAKETVGAVGRRMGLDGADVDVIVTAVVGFSDLRIYFGNVALLVAAELSMGGVERQALPRLLEQRLGELIDSHAAPSTNLVRRLRERLQEYQRHLLKDLDDVRDTTLRRSILMVCNKAWAERGARGETLGSDPKQGAGTALAMVERDAAARADPTVFSVEPGVREAFALGFVHVFDARTVRERVEVAGEVIFVVIPSEEFEARLTDLDSEAVLWWRRWMASRGDISARPFERAIEAWLPSYFGRLFRAGRERSALPGGQVRQRVLAEIDQWHKNRAVGAIEREFENSLLAAVAWERAVWIAVGSVAGLTIAVFAMISLVSYGQVLQAEAAKALAQAERDKASAALTRETTERDREQAKAKADLDLAAAQRARAEAQATVAEAELQRRIADAAAARAAELEAKAAAAEAQAAQVTADAATNAERARKISAGWTADMGAAATPGGAVPALRAALCTSILVDRDSANAGSRLDDGILQGLLAEVGVGAPTVKVKDAAPGDGWLAWVEDGTARQLALHDGARFDKAILGPALSVIAEPGGAELALVQLAHPDGVRVRAGADVTAEPVQCKSDCAKDWARPFWVAPDLRTAGAAVLGDRALAPAPVIAEWRTRFEGIGNLLSPIQVPVDGAWASPDGRTQIISTPNGAFQVIAVADKRELDPRRLTRATYGWRNAREYEVSATIADNTPLLSLSWTPSGKAFSGLSIDGTAVLYTLNRYSDVNTRPIIVAPGPYDHVAAMEIAPKDGEPLVSDYLLAATDKRGWLDVWRSGGALLLRQQASSGPASALTVDHTSRSILVVAANGELLALPVQGGAVARVVRDGPVSAGASPARTSEWRRVATGIDVSRGGVWRSLHRGRVQAAEVVGSGPAWLRVASDGRRFTYPLDHDALIATVCDRLATRTAEMGTCEHPYVPEQYSAIDDYCQHFPMASP